MGTPPQEKGEECTADQLQTLYHRSCVPSKTPCVGRAVWWPFGRKATRANKFGSWIPTPDTFRRSYQGWTILCSVSQPGGSSRRWSCWTSSRWRHWNGTLRKSHRAPHSSLALRLAPHDHRRRQMHVKHIQRLRRGLGEKRIVSKEVPPTAHLLCSAGAVVKVEVLRGVSAEVRLTGRLAGQSCVGQGRQHAGPLGQASGRVGGVSCRRDRQGPHEDVRSRSAFWPEGVRVSSTGGELPPQQLLGAGGSSEPTNFKQCRSSLEDDIWWLRAAGDQKKSIGARARLQIPVGIEVPLECHGVLPQH